MRASEPLESFDEAGIDQQPVEAPRRGAVVAAIELARALPENTFLFREGGIERKSRGLQRYERQIGRIEAITRGRQIGRAKIHGINRIIGRTKLWIERSNALRAGSRLQLGMEHVWSKERQMIAEAHDQKGFRGEILRETALELQVGARAHALPTQILVD